MPLNEELKKIDLNELRVQESHILSSTLTCCLLEPYEIYVTVVFVNLDFKLTPHEG